MKYADAGVNIQKADEAMGKIKSLVKGTFTPEVMADFGNFGGLFSISSLNMKEPVLVSSVDGVGTKTKLAVAMKKYPNPGQDIVNHCVDDILVQGARPLFFLDYFGTGVLDPDVLKGVVEGLALACRENGCALLGGETAEMPGVYHGDDFDLAGTIVGVVDKARIIDGSRIKTGDIIIGLPSTGLHTNGYSLARKVLLESASLSLNHTPKGWSQSIGETLVVPHRSYLNCITPLLQKDLINGLVHITGGGYKGNIPRILPAGVSAQIDRSSWVPQPVFGLIQELGAVEKDEMYSTFNMGMGMTAMISAQNAKSVMSMLQAQGECPVIIGEIIKEHTDGRVIFRDHNAG